MGAINTSRLSDRFPTDKSGGRDADGAPLERGSNYAKVYRMFRTMLELGNPFAGNTRDTPQDISAAIDNLSIAQMKTHVATHIGQVIANEIANDPASKAYAGKTDAQQAQLMTGRNILDLGFTTRSQLLHRTAVNGNVLTVEAENGAPLALSQFLGARGLSIVFYEQTPTVALRGQRITSTGNITDVTIELNGVPPGMTNNDLFRITVRNEISSPRRVEIIFRRIPFAPADGVREQDIFNAKA